MPRRPTSSLEASPPTTAAPAEKGRGFSDIEKSGSGNLSFSVF
jgi:hypothetical protein